MTSCLPGAKLAAVTREASTGTIYGVVYREGRVSMGFDKKRVRAWLLGLSETGHGSFYWNDFVPACKSCEKALWPAGVGQCPACQGLKGPGQCFQFSCGDPDSFEPECDNFPEEAPQAYCGSHPFFQGCRLPDQMVGDAGPALWEEEVEGDDNFSVPMAATCGAGCSEVFVFQGYRYRQETHTRLFALNANGPAIISSYQVPQARGPYTFVSFLEDLPHLFALVQGYNAAIQIWRYVRGHRHTFRIDNAVVNFPEQQRFGEQVVYLRWGVRGVSSCVVALSKHSIWALDVPQDLAANATAADLANKVSWRKVMDLPLENQEAKKDKGEDEDSDDEDPEELPPRLLSAGPKGNQVMIFKTQGSEGFCLKPWLLVEMCGDPMGREIRVTKVTSTASVPWKRKEEFYEVSPCRFTTTYCSLLPTVLRMNERHGGYLFFDQRGRIYRIRDEEILSQQDDWIAPSFVADSVQRVVTFKFPAESGAGRACLFSVLSRFEYFQKALDNWREGASAELVVTDATTQTFDLMLRYFHTGTLDSELTLENLVALLELGNKYLLPHLMALCMAKILRLLAEKDFIRDQKPTLMADLLLLASEASACGAFKLKIMDAIASCRPSLTHDADFLSRVAARSANLLAKLLSSINPPETSPEQPGSVPKRRRIRRERQRTLWGNPVFGRQLDGFPNSGHDDLPTWSKSASTVEEPRLP